MLECGSPSTHVVIAVSDWDRSNAFYRDVLGAEMISAWRAAFVYRFGNQQLNVHRTRRRAAPGRAAIPCGREQRPLLPVGGPIDEAVEHLGRHGVEIEEGPVVRPGGRGDGTSVYFRDPDGSLLELISYT